MAKPVFSVKQSKNKTVITAEGDMTVQHAAAIKKFFQEMIDKGTHDASINFKAVSAFDVVGIQLTFLYSKELHSKGKRLSIEWPADTAINNLFKKCNIQKLYSHG